MCPCRNPMNARRSFMRRILAAEVGLAQPAPGPGGPGREDALRPLVSVELAVLVAVQAEPVSGSGRDAGVGDFASGERRARAQREVRDRRIAAAVGAEQPAAEVEKAPVPSP